MRVAFFTPLPPTPSGIADYSAEVLSQLAAVFEIDVYTSESESLKLDKSNYRIFHHRTFDWQDVRKPYDRLVYQVGNNACHDFMIHHLYLHPGILVLHDWNLHRFRAFSLLARGDVTAYVDELTACHGLPGRQVAILTAQGFPSELLFHFFPMNKLLITNALVLAVHNQWSATKIHQTHPTTPIKVISSPFTPLPKPPTSEAITKARSKVGVKPEQLMLASFGLINTAKGIPSVFSVLKTLNLKGLSLKYVIVGHIDDRAELQELINRYEVSEFVAAPGYVSTEEFHALMAGTDIGINLRYPTQGETSAVLVKLLAYGKPVIVPDYRQFRELPRVACWHIPLGPKLALELQQAIERLAQSPDLRQSIGSKARQYAEQDHDFTKTIKQYVELITDPRGDRNLRRSPMLTSGLAHCPNVAQELVSEISTRCAALQPASKVYAQIRARGDDLFKPGVSSPD